MTDEAYTPAPLPRREPEGHKGDFGAVCVVGGCASERRMIGAPALAAIAALRSGAGLARLATPEPVLNAALTIAPSATGFALAVDEAGEIVAHEAAAAIDALVGLCDCLAIGPALGVSEGARAASLRAVMQEDVPVVVDADALNNLAAAPELVRDFRAAAVLTPHPGEYRRLGSALSLSHDPAGDDGERLAACAAMAQRLGAVVVLKGARSVVSDGQRSWVSEVSCDALATAGTGDVLTGVIAGLIAQFVSVTGHPALPAAPGKPLDLFDAACLGVCAHAAAAVRWRDGGASAGMLARELADHVPGALEGMRG